MLDTRVKVTKTYSKRDTEKKLLGDATKANKLAIVKRRRLNKGTVIKDENIEVVDIGEGNEVQDEERIRSFPSKSKSLTKMKYKYITVKKKKAIVEPGPKKRKMTEVEPDSGSKRRKMEEIEK